MTAPRLGIGLLYQPALAEFINGAAGLLDYVEVIPDTVWCDRGAAATPRFVDDAATVSYLEQVATRVPLVLHGIGLSIGSTREFDTSYVDQLARWQARWGSPWVSEHLAFSVADVDGGPANVGLTMPVTLDHETVDLVAVRARQVVEQLPVPFLLENNVYYFDVADEELSEPRALSLLCERSGCGLLLDLHNLHVNCRNNGVDPAAYLSELDLDRVVELHVAGGMEIEGFYVDAHSGSPPDAVWSLAEDVVPRCHNLGGITFELLGSWFEPLGADALAADLRRLRAIWDTVHASSPR